MVQSTLKVKVYFLDFFHAGSDLLKCFLFMKWDILYCLTTWEFVHTICTYNSYVVLAVEAIAGNRQIHEKLLHKIKTKKELAESSTSPLKASLDILFMSSLFLVWDIILWSIRYILHPVKWISGTWPKINIITWQFVFYWFWKRFLKET